jgi:hypothetical protein
MNTEIAVRDALHDVDISVRPEFLRELRACLDAEAKDVAELAEQPAPHRHRRRNILLTAVAAVLVVAIGAFAFVQKRSDDKQEVSVATGAEADARALAQQMLDALVLPPGARMQTSAPTSKGPEPLGPSTQVQASAQWLVPESNDAATRFFRGRRPAEFRSFGNGSGQPGNEHVIYWQLKTLPAGTADATLVVTISDAPVGARVDASATVTWYPERPASETIPERDKVAIIDQYPKNQHKIVTDPAEVAKLIDAFDRSHLLLDGPHSCPPISDPNALLYTVRFAPASNSPADVVIKRPAHTCGGAEVTVNGRAQPSVSTEQLDQAVSAVLPS